MQHEPSAQQGQDLAADYKSRLGVGMFVLYGLIYAGFVAINVISPVMMEKKVLFGLNLAVIYGFGLIVFALLLALVYNRLCAVRERDMGHEGEGRE